MSLSCPFGHFGEKPGFGETAGVVTERHRRAIYGVRDPPLRDHLGLAFRPAEGNRIGDRGLEAESVAEASVVARYFKLAVGSIAAGWMWSRTGLAGGQPC
jgi:hypothetical protein